MAITAQTRTELVQLVVSMLGAAPSTAQLTDLVTKANAGSTIQELADSLATNADFAGNYPVWLTAQEFTSKVVTAMFAGSAVTAADQEAAVDYIAGAITAGTFTKTSAVVALTSYLASADGVANATYGSAAQSYQNKVEVAEYYTITAGLGGSSKADLTAAIAGVTSDAATVTSQKAAADTVKTDAAAAAAAALLPQPKAIALSAALDSGAKFTGGDADDVFSGTMTFSAGALAAASTVTAGDTMDGGAGEDKLEITVTGAALGVTLAGEVATPVLTNIETVHVRSFETANSGVAGAGATIVQDSIAVDLSNATGVTNIGTSATNNVEADVVFQNVNSLASVTMSGKGDLHVAYAAAVTAGLETAGTLTLNDVGTSATVLSAVNIAGVETLNIASSGGSNFFALENNDYTTINVSGDQALVIDVNDAGVTTFNAGAATGKITADLSALTNASILSAVGGTGATDKVALGGADVSVTLLTNGLSKFSGFETLQMDTANNIALSADTAGISDFDLTGGTNQAQTVTLSDGYTLDTTVTIESTNDSVVNNANVGLTVSGVAATLASTLTGGTGTDALAIVADGSTTTIAAGVTGFETLTLSTPATNPAQTVNLTTDDANIAAGKTLTVTATGTNALAAVTFSAAAETTATLDYTGNAAVDTITGGAGADTIRGGGGKDIIDGGAGNDTLHGDAGDDTITMGGGVDTVKGGDGKDTIIAAGNLAATDIIDGGDGTDTLRVTAVSGAVLAGVTNVENLQISGGSTVSLSSDLAFTTIDIDEGLATNTTETLTLAKGYTAETAISADAGDTVTNTGADAVITVSAWAPNLEAADSTTLTGSDKAGVINTLNILNIAAAIVDMSTITNFDAINVNDYSVTAGNDITLAMGSYASAVTIDSSSLDKGEVLTMTGTPAGALTFKGGNGGDTVILSSAATGDNITLGSGTNTITAGTNISYLDTIAGGAGADTMAATALTDVDLQNVTGVETLNATGAVLGSFSDAAGVIAVRAMSNAAIDGTTRANGLTVYTFSAQTDTWTGGSGDDNFIFDSAGTGVAADTISGGLGTNTITILNETPSDGTTTIGEATAVTLDKIAKIQNVVISDGATDNALGDVTLTMTDANAVYDISSLDVDATSLDVGEDFTFDASGITATDEAFVVRGGSGVNTLTGGGAADSLTGGSGADVLTGGGRADTLTGGSGADDFIYAVATSANTASTSARTDTITDFTTLSDEIKLNVAGVGGAAYDVDFNDKGDAASIADGLALLSGTRGEYFFNTGTSQFVVDLDGNGLIQSTDLIINMTGLTAFSSKDVDVDLTGITNTSNIKMGGGTDSVSTLTNDIDFKAKTISGIEIFKTMTDDKNITIDAADLLTNAITTVNGVNGGNAELFVIDGAAGGETIDVSGITLTDITIDINAGTGIDVITGGAGNDDIDGNSGADIIRGGAGNDIIAVGGTDGVNDIVILEATAALNGVDVISEFVKTEDDINLDALTTETATTTLTGSLTPAAGKVYFASADYNDALTTIDAALATAFSGLAVLAASTVKAYLIAVDTGGTDGQADFAVYEWQDAGADEIVAGELTLMASGDTAAALVAGDFIFA